LSESRSTPSDGRCSLRTPERRAGRVARVAGFLALGGRIPPWLSLLPTGASLLIGGFALVVINLAMTVWQARSLSAPARFVLFGLIGVCATITLGGSFSVALFERAAGPLLSKMLATGVPVHAIAGLGRWLTLTGHGRHCAECAVSRFVFQVTSTEATAA
jgi:hypothetical protein